MNGTVPFGNMIVVMCSGSQAVSEICIKCYRRTTHQKDNGIGRQLARLVRRYKLQTAAMTTVAEKFVYYVN